MPRSAIATVFAIDIHFACPGCEQLLVAERAGSGTLVNCPSCLKTIEIPTLADADPHVGEMLQTWRNHARESARKLKKNRELLGVAQSEQQRLLAECKKLKERLMSAQAARDELAVELSYTKSRSRGLNLVNFAN